MVFASRNYTISPGKKVAAILPNALNLDLDKDYHHQNNVVHRLHYSSIAMINILAFRIIPIFQPVPC